MLKKFISFSTAAIISLATIISCPFTSYGDTLNYVALGDSIASGYGLTNIEAERYSTLISEHLSAISANYGIDGLNSTEFLAAIKANPDLIKDTDIITVSIGSNDLLRPLMKIVADTFGVNANSPTLNQDIVNRILEIYNAEDGYGADRLEIIFRNLDASLEDNDDLNLACETFVSTNFNAIVSAIKEINPDAELYISNIYNPYYGMIVGKSYYKIMDLGAIGDRYVSKMNKAFDYKSDAYTVIDAYSYMNEKGLTNAVIDFDNLAASGFDPHPNINGHLAIYSASKEALVDYGNINYDGVLSASSAAAILQYVLNSTEQSENWLLRANVDENDGLTASDSACVLQKVLNNEYIFPIIEAKNSGVELHSMSDEEFEMILIPDYLPVQQ